MITVYGLSTCGTCRKARRWLSDEGLEHRFHDFRRDGVDSARVAEWLTILGWESVLNRRSTTWRSLSAQERASLDADHVLGLVLDYPALIKRPVIDIDGKLVIGFEPGNLGKLTEGLAG